MDFDPDQTQERPPAGADAARQKRRASGLSGTQLDQYDVGDEIGRGGMGVVYRGRDRTLDRTVAIKVLSPHLTSNEDFASRFIREARAAARLDHAGIVQVYQAGQTDDALFIAMQYVDAPTLADIIDTSGRMDAERALKIIRQVADALQAAHAQGIVHRDIKPSNILLDASDRAKVMDFGLAKELDTPGRITRTGCYIGTPEYSSPEQCEAEDLDGRTDIYSLGIVLYEMVSGTVPFEAATPLKLFEKIKYEMPPPIDAMVPEIGDGMKKLLSRMMAKQRADRYASCSELIADIDRILRGEHVPTRPVSPARRRARISASLLIGGAAIAGIALAIALWPSGDRPPMTPEPAPVAAPIERRTLMVRDFENTTGADNVDWLRIGIADMLITDLAECEFLDVLSRDRVRQVLEGTGESTRADIELSGSFAESGGTVLVLAQVVDTSRGTVLRAVRASGTQADVFGIIDQVSAQVRDGLEDVLAERLGRPVQLASRGVGAALFKEDAHADAPASDRATARPPAPLAVAARADKAPGSGRRLKTASNDRSGNGIEPRQSANQIERKRSTDATVEQPDDGVDALAAALTDDEGEAYGLGGLGLTGAGEGGGGAAPGRGSLGAPPGRIGYGSANAQKAEKKAGPDRDTSRSSEPQIEQDGQASAAASRAQAVRRRDVAVDELTRALSAGIPPRVSAVRARYRARALLERDAEEGTVARALELLATARRLAPDLVGIDEEILQLRKRLGE